uniref:Uncharacterized protein n=1 Tax=Exiguobacterium arabatum TaxID=518693 RepID=B2G3K2_9BACL|nr:hypothetical protein [Exiguobacterium arabatum]
MNPQKDAKNDVKLQAGLSNTTGVFNSKKYYTKSRDVSRLRVISFVMILPIAFLLFQIWERYLNSDDTQIQNIGLYSLAIAVFSLLSSCIFFFSSFTSSYTEHQKEEYDFYYDYYLKNQKQNVTIFYKLNSDKTDDATPSTLPTEQNKPPLKNH